MTDERPALTDAIALLEYEVQEAMRKRHLPLFKAYAKAERARIRSYIRALQVLRKETGYGKAQLRQVPRRR